MDSSNSILLIVSLCCLLISGNAIHPTGSHHVSVSPSQAPAASAPNADDDYSLDTHYTTVTQTFRPDVIEFCKPAENPALCADTLLPRIHGALDPIKALDVQIDATLNHTKKVLSTISDLIDSNDNNKEFTKAIKVCKDQYNNILDSIKETRADIKKDDLATAWITFSSVLSYQATCEDAFKEASPDVNIPFPKESEALYQLGSNCLVTLASLNGQLY